VDALWGELRDRLDELFAELTLQERCRRKRQGVERAMYYIRVSLVVGRLLASCVLRKFSRKVTSLF
jgi:hypothetical protein